jgi:hypothetical protein
MNGELRLMIFTDLMKGTTVLTARDRSLNIIAEIDRLTADIAKFRSEVRSGRYIDTDLYDLPKRFPSHLLVGGSNLTIAAALLASELTKE